MEVVAAQVTSTSDPESNRSVVAAVLARNEAADLIVLPEASQMAFGDPGGQLAIGAEPLDGPFVDLLARASRSGRTIVAGMFEESGSERPFNTTVVLRGGELVGCYRKIHLYDALGFEESAGIALGPADHDALVVVDLGELTLGVMTCFDLRFPEMAAALCERGADLIALGAAWVPGARKAEQWEALLAARAIETTSFVIAAAQPAPRYCGHSRVLDPTGRLLASAGAERDCEVSASISAELLEEVRTQMPVLGLRRLRGA